MIPANDGEAIEREIIGRIRAAKIRLRFDRVVLSLVGGLKDALAEVIPEGQAIVFTLTAPIKLPSKTAAAMERLMRELKEGERRAMIQGNQVRIRLIKEVPEHGPKLMGFVHSPQADAGLILDIAETRMFDG